MKRILRFPHNVFMTYWQDDFNFGLFPEKGAFDNLEPEQTLEIMNQASALISKIEQTGRRYNEREFLLV